MKNSIQNIGTILDVDENGFVVKQAAVEKIQTRWRPAVDVIVAAYRHHFGRDLYSVYIRGSVALGRAIDNISDIDSIALVNMSREKIDLSWRQAFEAEFAKSFLFINGVEIIVQPLGNIGKGSRIMIKTQAVCVYGEDISDTLPSLKPGEGMAQHIFGLERDIKNMKDFLRQDDKDSAEIQRKCTWIMKRILRSGCELVMERSQSYTRDLYPCYELFARYYPQKDAEMYRVLEMAVNPTSNRREIINILDDFGGWITGEIGRVFEKNSNSTD